MTYDRNAPMRREATNRHPAYAVQMRLFYEDAAMDERVNGKARPVGHYEARRAVAQLQRRARLDANATPIRSIP